jgi:hypothetical protein
LVSDYLKRELKKLNKKERVWRDIGYAFTSSGEMPSRVINIKVIDDYAHVEVATEVDFLAKRDEGVISNTAQINVCV